MAGGDGGGSDFGSNLKLAGGAHSGAGGPSPKATINSAGVIVGGSGVGGLSSSAAAAVSHPVALAAAELCTSGFGLGGSSGVTVGELHGLPSCVGGSGGGRL